MEPRRLAAGNIFGREGTIASYNCMAHPIGCGRSLTQLEISSWDLTSQREYSQSGWCIACQDRVFRDPERCTCDDGPCCEVDIGVGILTCEDKHQRPCPVHFVLEDDHDYDPDLREDEPPVDMKEIEWTS